MLIQRKGIFSFLEADDDGGEEATAEPAGQDEAPAPEESGEDADGDDVDDDFNIDTSLDGNDNGDGDDEGGMDDSSSSDTSSSGSLDSGEEEAPVQANTDIFGSLTPEEQKMKIKELKNLYSELYSSTDDLIERINQTNTDEDNIEVVSRVTSTLYSLRQYMMDYITQLLPIKSYYENDVNFTRFLSMINGIATVIEQLGAIKIARSEGKTQ